MPLKSPIIAFDLDGTLVDSVGDIAHALNGGLRELGLSPCSVADVRGYVGHGARNLVRQALVAQGADPAREDALLAAFRAHYEHTLVSETAPYPGVPEMLAALRGKAILAVATNKPGALARPLVEQLLPRTFALVLGPDDVEGSLKPDPLIVRRIAAELNGTVVAFVGDSGVDMETAKNAGVPAIAVAWGLRPDEARALADHVVDSGPALTALLDGLLTA